MNNIRLHRTLAVLTLAVLFSVSAIAQALPGLGIVATYNLNEGTDFQQVVGVSTAAQFLLGVGQIVT